MRLQIERDLLVGSSVGEGLQPPAWHRPDRGRVAPGLRGVSWWSVQVRHRAMSVVTMQP